MEDLRLNTEYPLANNDVRHDHDGIVLIFFMPSRSVRSFNSKTIQISKRLGRQTTESEQATIS